MQPLYEINNYIQINMSILCPILCKYRNVELMVIHSGWWIIIGMFIWEYFTDLVESIF